MLTQEYVKSILDYDPQTGIFRWKTQRRGILPGDIAGGGSRYVFIGIDYKVYRAHHLAWLIMTGGFPPSEIDHIDLDKKNNAWRNLRLATRSLNAANQKTPRTNKSGLKGVSAHGAKWRAFIKINGKGKNLGTFQSKELAHQAYIKAAKVAFGEFARA